MNCSLILYKRGKIEVLAVCPSKGTKEGTDFDLEIEGYKRIEEIVVSVPANALIAKNATYRLTWREDERR